MPSKRVPGVKALSKIFFHSQKITEMVRFYRAIGLPPVKRYRHECFLHVQCKAPGFELWILEGEDITRNTTAERRAVLLDPDGRPIDLTERTSRRRTCR